MVNVMNSVCTLFPFVLTSYMSLVFMYKFKKKHGVKIYARSTAASKSRIS